MRWENNAIFRRLVGGIRQKISLRKWVRQKIDDADGIKLLRGCLPVVDEIESDADGAAIFKAHNAYLLDADVSTQLSLFSIVSDISLPRGSEECQYSDTYCRFLQ